MSLFLAILGWIGLYYVGMLLAVVAFAYHNRDAELPQAAGLGLLIAGALWPVTLPALAGLWIVRGVRRVFVSP